MEKSDDCGKNIGDVEDDRGNCSNVKGEEDGEIDIPGFLIPFLHSLKNTLLVLGSYSSSPSFFSLFFSSGFLSG